jgi:hypothetical protein
MTSCYTQDQSERYLEKSQPALILSICGHEAQPSLLANGLHILRNIFLS